MDTNTMNCICEEMLKLPKYPVIAMAYVPFQTELVTYTCVEAFNNGTLFPELDKKFYGGKCCG